MISVEEALSRILDVVEVLGDEERPLLDCLGRVLGEDIYAPFDVPPHDNSAMDGYAALSTDINNASPDCPVVLGVIGQRAAGSVDKLKVGPGKCIRIMTGAVIPDGADVVIPFELTDEVERKQTCSPEAEIGIICSLPPGSNIRRKGEDISKGELVIGKGRVLRPAELGVLASLGETAVPVVRRPVVGILATGNEVMDISQPLLPGKIYNSNSYSLAAQVLALGGVPKLMGIAPDNESRLSEAIRSGLDCDMLITSGGVSMGDYDIVKKVLAAEGDISFWTVRMKPGKPLAFGVLKRGSGRKVPHLGLPGNPVSSMITFEIFARPSILKMAGRTDLGRPTIKAILEEPLRNNDGRRIYARVIVDKRNGRYYASLTGEQGSGVLTSMAKANGLAIIPESTGKVMPGMAVEVILLSPGGSGIEVLV